MYSSTISSLSKYDKNYNTDSMNDVVCKSVSVTHKLSVSVLL